MKMKFRKMMGSFLAVVVAVSLMWEGVSLPIFAEQGESLGGEITIGSGGDKGLDEEMAAYLRENVRADRVPDEGAGSSMAVQSKDETEDPLLNYRDVPGNHDVQSLEDGQVQYSRDMGSLPSRYDNRDFASYMPDLRDQGKFGSCWAQASMAAMEINLARKGLLKGINLSEVQYAYFTYNWVTDPLKGTAGDSNKGIIKAGESYLGTGGSVEYGKGILMSWTGAAAEEGPLVYPSSPSELPSSLDPSYAYNHDIAHLREYHEVNIDPSNGINSTDMIAAKNELMTKGSLIMSYRAINGKAAQTTNDIYNKTTNAYYDPKKYDSTNHAVTIVGWDDDFSAANFTQKPKGNGAWLVRNSWTTGNYEDHQSYSGYFWMSYYNAGIDPKAHSFDCELSSNYDHLYQYDGSMIMGSTWTNGVESAEFANVFQAKANSGGESLKAVSFNSPLVNTKYEVSVYVSNSSMTGNPTAGTLKASLSGSTSFAGYYTFDLNQPVALLPGQYYSVVVKLSTPGRAACIPIEMSETIAGYYSCNANMVRGQSYIKTKGIWLDGVDYRTGTGLTRIGNVRVKALTDNNPISPETDSLTLMTKKTKNIGILLSSGDSLKSVTTSNSNVATAKISGNSVSITAGKKKGSAVITVTSAKGYSASINVTVQTGKITTKKVTLSSKKATLFYIGEKYALSAIASPDRISTGEIFKASSGNKKVATVSVNKKTGAVTVTAKGNGKTKITVSCGSKKATCEITVKGPMPLKSIKYSKNVSIKAGKTKTVKITPDPKDASLSGRIYWYTYNRYVAMYSGVNIDKKNRLNVKIYGVGKGKTKFCVTVYDIYGTAKKASFNVTVK